MTTDRCSFFGGKFMTGARMMMELKRKRLASEMPAWKNWVVRAKKPEEIVLPANGTTALIGVSALVESVLAALRAVFRISLPHSTN